MTELLTCSSFCLTSSTLEPKRPSLGGESTLDALSGSVSSRFSQSLSPALSPPRASLGSPRLSLSPVVGSLPANGAMQSPQPVYLAVPDSGEGGDRSERESNTSRERANSNSLRAAGGNASVSVLAQGDVASASSAISPTGSRQDRDPTSVSHSYGLESYESNEDGLCISFTSEEESEGEGGAERAARKKSKLSFFQKLHKHKKRT